MQGIASHAPRLKAIRPPKALGSRRSGRAGEPAAGQSVRASESLDDVPQDPRLPSYPPGGPADRLRDLYGSLSRIFDISLLTHFAPWRFGALFVASGVARRLRCLAPRRNPFLAGNKKRRCKMGKYQGWLV